MRQHMEKRVLPYTPEQLFDLVADIEKYPLFLPWCQEATVLRKSETSLKAVLLVGYKAMKDSFTSLVTLDPPRSILVEYGGGPLKHLKNEWRFQAAPGGACEVTFFVAFDFKSVLLAHLMDHFFDYAFCKMVGAFEKRAEELYGPRPAQPLED